MADRMPHVGARVRSLSTGDTGTVIKRSVWPETWGDEVQVRWDDGIDSWFSDTDAAEWLVELSDGG